MKAQGYIALVAFAALAAIAYLVMFLVRSEISTPPPDRGDRGDHGVCAAENLCPANGGADTQCCLGTELCYAADFLCCAKEHYQPAQDGRPAFCCPPNQRKTSGGCCALGTLASGDACREPCPDNNNLCNAPDECLQATYSSDEQKTQIAKDLVNFKPYVDTENKRISACVPPAQGCAAQAKQNVMPATINNSVLGYNRGKYAFDDTGDLCSEGHCILQDLVDRGTPLAQVEARFRNANALADGNKGLWCGKAGETFLLRSVEGLQNCGWKRCFEELSYTGLQRLRFNAATGACAGLFMPKEPGIVGGEAKDEGCEVLGDCSNGPEFCTRCLQSPSSAYDCDASGSVLSVDSAKTKFYCGNGGCEQCHSAGAQVQGMSDCSQLPPTKNTYDSLFDCTTNEKDCRGTCKFDNYGDFFAPWYGLCEPYALYCGCNPAKLAEIWGNNPNDRAALLGKGDQCLRGTEPWPAGTGSCRCDRWFFGQDCHVTSDSYNLLPDCACRPKDEKKPPT